VHRHLAAPAAGKERRPVALVHHSGILVVTAAGTAIAWTD
jgi:hypothetical protein